MSLELERQRLEIEYGRLHNDGEWLKLENYKVKQEALRPFREAVLRFAELTVRSLLLLNGASALSLLTFAGAANAQKFAGAIIMLSGGAALAVVTAGLSYLAQAMIAESKHGSWVERLGEGVRIVAILSGAASLGAFCWGIYRATSVLG